MPESHKHIYDNTYGTNEKFFRRMKIHNYKDADYRIEEDKKLFNLLYKFCKKKGNTTGSLFKA